MSREFSHEEQAKRCPCFGCSHVEHCRQYGNVCYVFVHYTNTGRLLKNKPRDPVRR